MWAWDKKNNTDFTCDSVAIGVGPQGCEEPASSFAFGWT